MVKRVSHDVGSRIIVSQSVSSTGFIFLAFARSSFASKPHRVTVTGLHHKKQKQTIATNLTFLLSFYSFNSMIPAKAFRYSRHMALRGHTRILSALYSSLPNPLPPILPTPAPADPNGSTSSRNDPGFLSRWYERYSPISQRERIRIAELFFLAATRQASDP